MESWHMTEQALMDLDFRYGRQILAALLPMGLTVILHGIGIDQVLRFFKRFGRPVTHDPRRTVRTAVTIGVVAILLVSHFVGVVVWAVFYYLTGMTGNMSHAMFYSINAYTTMGDSNMVLPGKWAGFGNFEAMTAILMFGWSTAVLANIVGKFHNPDE